MNLLESIGLTDKRSGTSRMNAQEYGCKLIEAIAILSDVNNKAKINAKAIRICSSDTIFSTPPITINGKLKIFKMAFSHGDLDPYAVEIIEVEDDK